MRWDYVSVELRPLTGPLIILRVTHEWIWSSGEMILTAENQRTRRKTCLSTTSFTTNFTWIVLGENSGLRGEKQAPNRLCYGKALTLYYTLTCSTSCLLGYMEWIYLKYTRIYLHTWKAKQKYSGGSKYSYNVCKTEQTATVRNHETDKTFPQEDHFITTPRLLYLTNNRYIIANPQLMYVQSL
jgi:hypothetical protein